MKEYDPKLNDFFKYNLPTNDAKYYAEKALKTLKHLKKHFPEFYESFKAPSEVLTLSGVRAFDTYYDLGEEVSSERILALKSYLSTRDIRLLLEKMPFLKEERDESNAYSLIHIKALNEIPERYKNCPNWRFEGAETLEADRDFFHWWLIWQQEIILYAHNNSVLLDWYRNELWAGHNITFGMLLGYPGEAIASCLWNDENVELVGARILHAEKFERAYPVYYYAVDLQDNKNIKDHENLWSEILTLVYEEIS